jgi:hypothetical protein
MNGEIADHMGKSLGPDNNELKVQTGAGLSPYKTPGAAPDASARRSTRSEMQCFVATAAFEAQGKKKRD